MFKNGIDFDNVKFSDIIKLKNKKWYQIITIDWELEEITVFKCSDSEIDPLAELNPENRKFVKVKFNDVIDHISPERILYAMESFKSLLNKIKCVNPDIVTTDLWRSALFVYLTTRGSRQNIE